VERTRPTRVDYANREIPTDYYALALSWSPAFCNPDRKGRAVRWQCEENAFGYVVHGLWPQSAKARSSEDHPRNCKAPELLAPELVRPYLCLIPGAQLAQDEWVKHGSCAWPDAKGYFQQIEKLYQALQVKDPPAGRTTAGAVRRSFVAANAAKGLRSEHVQVRVRSRNQFSELLVCYDKRFQFRACPGPGTPDGIEIFVEPRRR
jgi:ribonuclease T2